MHAKADVLSVTESTGKTAEVFINTIEMLDLDVHGKPRR
jgi:hypothetical protein